MSKESLNPITQPCCAHLTVIYKTRQTNRGLTCGWWECKDCGHPFAPIPVPVMSKREAYDGDWTNETTHENGNYSNTCSVCGRDFQGYKRRVVCKYCFDKSAKEQPDDCREAFEAWCKNPASRNSFGGYYSEKKDLQCEAWIAGAAWNARQPARESVSHTSAEHDLLTEIASLLTTLGDAGDYKYAAVRIEKLLIDAGWLAAEVEVANTEQGVPTPDSSEYSATNEHNTK